MKLSKDHKDILSVIGKSPVSFRFLSKGFDVSDERIKVILADLIAENKIEIASLNKSNNFTGDFYRTK